LAQLLAPDLLGNSSVLDEGSDFYWASHYSYWERVTRIW
jgi:hypothetical protein